MLKGGIHAREFLPLSGMLLLLLFNWFALICLRGPLYLHKTYTLINTKIKHLLYSQVYLHIRH